MALHHDGIQYFNGPICSFATFTAYSHLTECSLRDYNTKISRLPYQLLPWQQQGSPMLAIHKCDCVFNQSNGHMLVCSTDTWAIFHFLPTCYMTVLVVDTAGQYILVSVTLYRNQYNKIKMLRCISFYICKFDHVNFKNDFILKKCPLKKLTVLL